MARACLEIALGALSVEDVQLGEMVLLEMGFKAFLQRVQADISNMG